MIEKFKDEELIDILKKEFIQSYKITNSMKNTWAWMVTQDL